MRIEDYILDNDRELAVSAQQSYITRVYGWMAGALVITALVALNVANSGAAQEFLHNGGRLLLYGMLFAQLGVVFVLSGMIDKLNAVAATALFVVYSILTGVTLSSIFMIYTAGSLATTFGVTAGTFALMSLYGYTTKRDLTSIGSLGLMALVGIIIASIVNIFLQSTILYWGISCIGVVIFVGLIAYDTQKIKEMASSQFLQGADENTTHKYAVIGALRLYLDFINLFLYLLRFLGNRK
jgi:uncharacterized protein